MTEQQERELCAGLVRYAFDKINARICNFYTFLMVNSLDVPPSFNLEVGGWQESERAIEKAFDSGNASATYKACLDYETRADTYINAWRVKLEKQLAAKLEAAASA